MHDGDPQLAAQVRLAAPQPAVRLVAIDLDGTLLNSAKRISDQTIEALQCLPEQGVRVVISSARPPRSVRHIYQMLRLDTYQINYNGALIWDEPKRQTVFHQPMDCALVRRMIDRVRGQYPQALVTCEIMDRWYTDRADQTYTTETGRLFKPDVVAPVESFCTEPITKLLFLCEKGVIARIDAMLKEAFKGEVTVVRTDEQLVQVMHPRASKSRSLKRVAAHYGVHAREIMAIGDAPNDVGMLQLAGVAVAMDNAHPLVKRVAHWIAPSNDDHGVHAALVRYGLCE